MDHAENDCLVISVTTHGILGNLAACDVLYDVNTLWAYFTDELCRTLCGKPRLFFIQACRGDKADNGCEIIQYKNAGKGSCSSSEKTDVDITVCYPSMSTTNTIDIPDDHLVYYSTVAGISCHNKFSRKKSFK